MIKIWLCLFQFGAAQCPTRLVLSPEWCFIYAAVCFCGSTDATSTVIGFSFAVHTSAVFKLPKRRALVSVWKRFGVDEGRTMSQTPRSASWSALTVTPCPSLILSSDPSTEVNKRNQTPSSERSTDKELQASLSSLPLLAAVNADKIY